jgi:hypothetical protein
MSRGTSRRPLAGVEEIAEYLQLPVKTVRRHVFEQVGVGVLSFKVGRYRRWDWNEVEAWVEQQKCEARQTLAKQAA